MPRRVERSSTAVRVTPKTSPVISLLGKSFSNMEGSVRHLAPELSLVEVFEDEMQGILIDLARENVSMKQTARAAVEVMLGASSATEQIRTILRDTASRQLTLRTGQDGERRSRRTRTTVVAAAFVAGWLAHQHRGHAARSRPRRPH